MTTKLDRLEVLTRRMRVLALNAGQRLAVNAQPWYRISNAADVERATVQLFGEIGWDVDASDFARDFRAITAPNIDLEINSPGGSAWDGFAIYNVIKGHDSTVTAHVLGIAASAASFIAMAADSIVAYRPSQMMIHKAGTLAWGNADDMREVADILDQLDGEIADTYARKAGGDRDTWLATMKAETWYTPDSALAAGLVDSIAGDDSQSDDSAGGNDDSAPAESAASARLRAHAQSTITRARARLALGRGETQ